MSPIRKAWGVALMAALALAVLAPAAVADTHHFTTHDGEPVELTAEALETQVITFDEKAVKVKCNRVDFRDATVEDGDTTITTEPVYNNGNKTCTAEPIGTASIDTNGCHYQFMGATSLVALAEMSIVGCDEGKPGIQITAALSCTITIPEQLRTGVFYEKRGTTPTEDITLLPAIHGIEYSITPSCAFVMKDRDDGTYVGAITLTGWEDNGSEAGHGEEQRGLGYVTTED